MGWVWLGLSLASLGYFVWLFWRLITKSKGVLRQATPMANAALKLAKAIDEPASYQPNVDAITVGLEATLAARANLLRKRAKASEQRQRRLIARISDLKPEESEFNNGRT